MVVLMFSQYSNNVWWHGSRYYKHSQILSKEILWQLFLKFKTVIWSAYLPGMEVNRDHQGGSSRVRPFHCTSVGLTPAITPNVGNSNA